MVKELKPEEFDEHLMPIFESVAKRVHYAGGEFNPGHFFPHWRKLMELNIARTWEMPGDAVLSAVFVKHTFTGEMTGLISFWFKRAGAPNAEPLIEAAKAAGKELGCRILNSSEHCDSNPMEAKYNRMGFHLAEKVFRILL